METKTSEKLYAVGAPYRDFAGSGVFLITVNAEVSWGWSPTVKKMPKAEAEAEADRLNTESPGKLPWQLYEAA